MADPISAGLAIASVGSSLLGASAQADAAAESQRQARTERRRTAFLKLQEDRKILRETSRERAAGLNTGAQVAGSVSSSAIAGGAAATTQAGAVAQGANNVQQGFFNEIQNSKIAEAGHLGRAQTFGNVSDIFSAGVTFRQNQLTNKAKA